MKSKNLSLLNKIVLFSLLLFAACQSKQDHISPVIQSITETVYASGLIMSKNQYLAFANVSGIVNQVLVDEGAVLEIGTPIISIANDAQKLMADNAKLSAEFNALNVNRGKINEAEQLVNLTKSQSENDASLLQRQKKLWSQNIGAKVDLEQRELAYERSINSYESAKENLLELENQLDYLSKQAQNNLLISKQNSGDYLVKSKVKGKVYEMKLTEGEMVTPQIPIAIIGDDEKYLLEMQIDEYDILDVKLGLQVLVVLNSYRDSVFDAVVSKINPIMNLQSKTFTVEAEFARPPSVLYPNISFEANVVISSKKNAMLIPRNYLLNDSTVVNKSGKQLIVKTGLKDYQMVEILSGIEANEQLILPEL